MRNRKQSPWADRIADAIEEAKTFDMDMDEDSFPTIHWLIARFMFQQFSLFEWTQLAGHYVHKIKNNLSHGINRLNERGIKVWIKRPLGVKKIVAISTDEKYREDDALRMKSHWIEATIQGLENMEDKHPNLLPFNMRRRFKRAIGDTKQLPLLSD